MSPGKGTIPADLFDVLWIKEVNFIRAKERLEDRWRREDRSHEKHKTVDFSGPYPE